MSNEHKHTPGRKYKTLKCILALSALAILVIVLLAADLFMPGHYASPLEETAKEFYYIDQQGLHWDYDALSRAYIECQNSISQKQLLNLMVISRAAHLVPGIIDSISIGGYGDTERKIHAIIALTGHDFSKEFDITRIFEKKCVEDTKQVLHQWWQQNSQEVIRSRGPKTTFNVPSHWPNLTLELKTEKNNYLQLEPIRFTTILRNNSDTWFDFIFKCRKPAFVIEYFKVLGGDKLIPIAKVEYPSVWITCGNARRWFTRPRFLTINPDSFHICQQWLNRDDENRIKSGKVAIRAVLKPLWGVHQNKQLISNDLTLEILEPKGPDAAAYKFITPAQMVDIGNGRGFSSGFMDGGLIRNSGSHHGRPLHEYFLNKYGDSMYANYVRYTLGRDASYSRRPEVLCKHMTDIVSIAPRDFPLLADAYVNLLEYYKETGELDKMSVISKTIGIESLNIVDPRLLQRLTELMNHVDEVQTRIQFKGRFGQTLLHTAAEKGPPAFVEFLISKGANVDETDHNGQTPLYRAAKAGRKEIVEILLAKNANPNIQTESFRRSPLFWPIENGNKEIVEILLNAGANVNVQDSSDRTPVHWAARQNQKEIVKLLMNAKDPNGWTPLHWAAHYGKKAMVQLLLNHGARIDAKDNKGQTPMDIAIENEDYSNNRKFIVELLRERTERR